MGRLIMICKLLNIHGSWREVADACNTTIGKDAGLKEPSSNWKRRLLMSEHSPIRKMKICAKWIDLPYWVSVHFTRHKHGVEHFCTSQRVDRTGTERNKAPQDAPITHEIEANFQAIINISQKRLCRLASPETQEAWKTFLGAIVFDEPELVSVCVPTCVYRGFCPEFKCCGYVATEEFRKERGSYISGN